jgi:hypothetical protein
VRAAARRAALAAGVVAAALAAVGTAGGAGRTIAGPVAPTGYDLPAGALVVRTSDELAAALAAPTPADVVLAPGVYDHPEPFVNLHGHRLFAEQPGQVVLRAGLVVGGHARVREAWVQGIVFDIADSERTLGSAILHLWGEGGAGARVLDCEFHGHGVVAYGLLSLNPAGLVAERLVFRDLTRVGLRASDNRSVRYGRQTAVIESIADIAVDGVAATPPGSSRGTAEAGLWIGHPVRAGVKRVKVRNVVLSGIEIVNNAWNTTYSDIDIDMRGSRRSYGVGVYLEMFSYRNTFRNFRIRARIGFNSEWADPARGGVAAGHFTVIEQGLIDAAGAGGGPRIGVYLDQGTESTTIRRVEFRNQNVAAIGAFRTIGRNRFSGNKYAGLLAGAVPISRLHIGLGSGVSQAGGKA